MKNQTTKGIILTVSMALVACGGGTSGPGNVIVINPLPPPPVVVTPTPPPVVVTPTPPPVVVTPTPPPVVVTPTPPPVVVTPTPPPVVVTPPSVIAGPFETVFGAACAGSEPTPGCTFNRSNGTRVKVTQDPHHDRYGYDENDLSYVKFDSRGGATVYDDIGNVVGTRSVSSFAGYVSGTTIGVGTTGFFWENVAGKTYWLGKNGVLYNANLISSNFGEAINSDDADDVVDTNLTAISSEKNKKLVRAAASRLQKQYGFTPAKATAVASALNRFAISANERGSVSSGDMSKTFKAVFGVEYKAAVGAVKDLSNGKKEGIKAMTAQSAKALGLKPAQAQAYIKGMYKSSLAQWGLDIDSVNW